MDKCVGVLAAVGDVKAACPLLPSSGVSIPLFFSYLFILHALLNKNHAFLFNTMRLLNISANFAVDYQHH